MDHQAHVRAAVSLINAVNSLLFWLRHLSDNLPVPAPTHNAVYIEFYNIMHQSAYLLNRFSTVLPTTTGLFQVMAHPPATSIPPTAPVQAAPEGPVAPPPQPPPRPPRDATGQVQAPEVQALVVSPPPLPCPRQSTPLSDGRRKSYLPRKL